MTRILVINYCYTYVFSYSPLYRGNDKSVKYHPLATVSNGITSNLAQTKGPKGQIVKCICDEKDAIRIICKYCERIYMQHGKRWCMAHSESSSYCDLYPCYFSPRILKQGVIYDRKKDYKDSHWNSSLYYLQHKLCNHPNK
jgi:hypothetical protein